MRSAPPIVLTEQDRTRLEALAAAADAPARVAQRARIILLAAAGVQNQAIAPRLGIGRAQVARWRERYVQAGLAGILNDLPRGAPPVKVDVARMAVLTGTDGNGQPRAWGVQSLATELGVSPASVSRHRRAAGLVSGNMRRTGYLPPAPFTGGMAEIVALYVSAPEHALVLAFDGGEDQDSNAGALPRMCPAPAQQRSLTASLLTASLLTALRVLDGELAQAPSGSGRHRQWLAFLQEVDAATVPGRSLWVFADNHACHQHAEVQQWLERHPRITVQLAPSAASWLRTVQGFLRESRAGQAACRTRFPSGIPEALAAIEAARRSRGAVPYRWIRERAAARVTDARTPSGARRPVLPVVGTKVLPPHGTGQLMPREALMARLMQSRRHRCVVIQGQAGSGKTSVLVAWRKAMISFGYDVCWLSLSVEDNDPARFLDYLFASIAESAPTVAGKVQEVGAGHDGETLELRIIALVQELSRRTRDLVLMIDDLHHVSDSRILRALQLLLDYAPPQLHVAVASRTALELSMERLRLQNLLAEFDMRDLRFSPEESARFLLDRLGSITPADAAAMHELTDGWVAGLQLLAIGLRK
ncbi:IS630 family transposase [Cupriavidus necator]|uniref:Transposase or inactivated derivative n=1 Tax=Cupriavidus necator (strain ATCC 17699 / DSM 428 / KCTC 22496 / NCIMB 10442 / H16 / Stanier 337) TaxID=381666 RepID=Q0K4A1_CUPNH|nr:IS630 family transposase [Cupriavidus necator]WKA44416.1 IS630 family transposase [Cupriavidus necator]CAJ95173.1 transposase or inactivated derivative [Cupriavidus necator H16]